MKRTLLLPIVAFVIGLPVAALATPSTEFWTAGTTDIQPFGIGHIDVDNYFTVFRKADAGAGAFPTDVGYVVGVLPFSKVQMEIGVDLLEPLDYPFFFNGKIGIPEDAFFKGQPALAGGIFDLGTQEGTTDVDITYINIGKTIPIIGRLFVGGYIGNKPSILGLVASGGNSIASGVTNKGMTVAWDRSFLPAKSAGGTDYYRLVVCADVATGKNFYGGDGGGIAWYFNENLSLLAGPVFFNDVPFNGQWKFSTQLDVNFKTW
jgi:hypothetical protein